MLTNILNRLPPTKFILIKDNLEEKGDIFLDFLVKMYIKRKWNIKYFILGSNFNKIQDKPNDFVQFYNLTNDPLNWLEKNEQIEDIIEKNSKNSVIIIDSIVHLIYLRGIAKTLKILNNLLENDVLQIITLFHVDLIDNIKILQLLEHQCTLHLNLETNNTVSYTYKKLGGKIVKDIESYEFINDNLTTNKIKINIEQILPNENEKQIVNPENLSTFKIGLSEKDQQSKKDLILPYLPKEGSEAGSVHYSFDNMDDWDEEDPDDDLDI